MYQESACYRVSTQIWSREEHALNRRDALNNEVRLITRFYGMLMRLMSLPGCFSVICLCSVLLSVVLWKLTG